MTANRIELNADLQLAKFQHDLTQYLGLWSIEPEKGNALAQSLRGVDWVAHFNASEALKAAGNLDGQYRPYATTNDGVAVISLSGVMTKQGSSFSSDGSTVRVRQKIRQALKDEQVGAILLVIDSPGGTVAGTADLADEVRKANAQKPVFAFVEDLCASAAYWVASQATEIHANNATAVIGSIGTLFVVRDFSGLFEKEGIKTHVIATGAFKGAGMMGAPITEDQIAHWQNLVDQTQTAFSAGVKSGRKMTAEQFTAIAEGRVWAAEEALKSKLIDAVSPFGDVVSRAASAASSKRKGRTMSAEKDDAPRGASLAELKMIGASADFVVQQLEKSATIAEAKNAWLDQRAAALDKRDEEMKAKAVDLDKREAAVAEKEKKAAAQKPGGLKPLADKGAGDQGGDGGTAESEFKSLVDEKIKAGVPRTLAVSAVVKENPDLQRRMIAETPSYAPPRA